MMQGSTESPGRKQVEAAQLVDVEMIGKIASQLGRGEEVKAQGYMAAVIELDFTRSRLLSCWNRRTFSIESTEIVGVLPTERTVDMKYLEVTRAISEEIFGRRATGRWLRTRRGKV
jgi:hypothetical protein